MQKAITIFWFRRDLRLHDNQGLFRAMNSGNPVLPVFIFDTEILGKLETGDARATFLHTETDKIKTTLEKNGSTLAIFHSKPIEAFNKILRSYRVEKVFANKDYEPYALERDNEIRKYLKQNGIEFRLFKDQVLFEENDVLKDDGKPYTVFTPYSRKWKKVLQDIEIKHYRSEQKLDNLLPCKTMSMPKLEELGFTKSKIPLPPRKVDDDIIRDYSGKRDLPAVNGTSRLGIHLRFGTISIRELIKRALNLSDIFLNELIWREFYMAILWHFPHVVDQSFRKKYDYINWRNNEKEFEKWCRGETGYPFVDAGMRELNETGFMHNRVRMVTASFLTKHLLIDWRWGEAYFAEKLLDYELASNNGNWQWAAGTGCDAAPYFRIFNPESQQKKFDPEGKYVKKWVPEYGTLKYVQPIVEHKMARERALLVYKEALG